MVVIGELLAAIHCAAERLQLDGVRPEDCEHRSCQDPYLAGNQPPAQPQIFEPKPSDLQ